MNFSFMIILILLLIILIKTKIPPLSNYVYCIVVAIVLIINEIYNSYETKRRESYSDLNCDNYNCENAVYNPYYRIKEIDKDIVNSQQQFSVNNDAFCNLVQEADLYKLQKDKLNKQNQFRGKLINGLDVKDNSVVNVFEGINTDVFDSLPTYERKSCPKLCKLEKDKFKCEKIAEVPSAKQSYRCSRLSEEECKNSCSCNFNQETKKCEADRKKCIWLDTKEGGSCNNKCNYYTNKVDCLTAHDKNYFNVKDKKDSAYCKWSSTEGCLPKCERYSTTDGCVSDKSCKIDGLNLCVNK